MIRGAVVIGAAGIMVKIIGVFFRIPLTNWIGELGMSYYQVAYTIYSALLIMATAGFPIALSRMISENVAMGRNRNAYRIFRVFLILMGVVGTLLFLLCYFGADAISAFVGNPLAASAVKSIAPAILILSLLSAYRGYFQGRQNMNPTALTQILEQLIRVIVGLTLTGILIKGGLERAAAGAAFGATAGATAALVFIAFIFILHKKSINKRITLGDQSCDDVTAIIRKILILAIPIIIGAEVIPIMNGLDLVMVTRRLQATGWSEAEAQSLYAVLSAFCSSLVGIPHVFIQSIAISIVPAIASATARNSVNEVRENVSLGYKLMMLISAPCAFGMLFLARPILYLMYPMRIEGAEIAVVPLMILSLSIIFISIYNTTTGILQAVNKQWLPALHLAIGALIKIPILFVTVGIESLNIRGACVSTVVAFVVAAYLNTRAVEKHTGVKAEIGVLLKPVLVSVIMGLVAFLCQKGLAHIIGGRVATVFAVLVGVIIYLVLAVTCRLVSAQELRMLPKGRKINAAIGRFIDWEE